MAQIRLDKFLASMGQGTRSEVKKQLKQGRVTVNGSACKKPECKVDPELDEIALDGTALAYQPFLGLMFHKPAGCVTATEDGRWKTVMDFIDHPRKRELFPVGRLDLDTEGLLLFLNDGELAHRMLSPKHHVPKTYFARVAGCVTQEDVEAFARGVDIGERDLTLPADLVILSVQQAEGRKMPPEQAECRIVPECPKTGENYISEISLTICEGKFHQVKRMFEARGKKVLYLKRTAMAGLSLDVSLAPGAWRILTKEEEERLQSTC